MVEDRLFGHGRLGLEKVCRIFLQLEAGNSERASVPGGGLTLVPGVSY
jgi:hypothetical protein